MGALVYFVCISFVHIVLGKGSESQIECTPNSMKVTVPMDGDRKISYLDQLKEYQLCKPQLADNVATYILDLQDHYRCGVTRVENKITGRRTYYHKIIIENSDGSRETVTVRCMVSPVKPKVLNRRAVDNDNFPLDFSEPEELDIMREELGHAPEPVLGALVKQNGKQVSGEISVSPGTPLAMEIFLDNSSAPVYGLLVNYMQVTDTGNQQETIIFNGCSVDPYLFDNFLTTDGDILAAKFKAFKFPDTTYVQFKGTVSVCLDKCQGVQCTNGVVGYGRRRRSVPSSSPANKVYEVSLTTFIKVDYKDGEIKPEDVTESLLKNLKVANQMLGDRSSELSSITKRDMEDQPIAATDSAIVSTATSLLVFISFCLAIWK